MKKVFVLSGVFSFVLLVLVLTGWAKIDDAVSSALNKGNGYYKKGDYQNAYNSYAEGLMSDPQNEDLNLNAAQAAEKLNDFITAINHYRNAKNSVDKYLRAGVLCYNLGENSTKAKEIAAFYAESVEFFMQGIIKYPQNVELKYNYEVVQKLLYDIQDRIRRAESGVGNETNLDLEDIENVFDNASNNGGGMIDGNGEGEGEGDSLNPGQSNGIGPPSQIVETNLDPESIERILQILAAQEEESLKNNREVAIGTAGEYGW